MKINKLTACAVLAFVLTLPAFAQVTSATAISVTVSSAPEAEVVLKQSWVFPFLQGASALTSGNNVKVNASFAVTPISLFGESEVVWTPVAFLQAIASAKFGSGWTYDLFGVTVKGIGINQRNADGSTSVIGDPFGGVIWNARAAGVFQFDLAALSPGDWHHVVFQTQQYIRYDSYSAASDTETWYTGNDTGENRNGFNYYGNFLLGYQMPIFLDTVALLAAVKQNLRVLDGGESWGDDLPRWIFSLLGNCKVTDTFGITLITQFITVRTFTDDTKDMVFYQDRRLTDADAKRHLQFYRVALVATFKLQ